MICITYDTDWIEPGWMETFLAKWSPPGRATFFQHRRFAALASSHHELCPHPAIASLDVWKESVVSLVREACPGARGLRTHSCVFSHAMGVGLREMGFEWISQANNQYQTELQPIRHPWGLWELPIYYMDNMDFWMPTNWPAIAHRPFDGKVIQNAMSDDDALFVFAFHPLHVALNTGTPSDYARVKHRVLEGKESPFDLRFSGRGTADFYEDLLNAMASRNMRSYSCSDALRMLSGNA